MCGEKLFLGNISLNQIQLPLLLLFMGPDSFGKY